MATTVVERPGLFHEPWFLTSRTQETKAKKMHNNKIR